MIRLQHLAIALACLGSPAFAAGPVDPDWPCIQRKQPALSVAQIWSGPSLPPEAEALAKTANIQALAQKLAARRTPMDQAQSLIQDFKANSPPPQHAALFLATFDHIQAARSRVMAGITRYAHKQAQLEAEIDQQRRTFASLLEAKPQDFDAIDKAEAAIDWSTRIFQDRQQSLTYVCETPVILEQRAFALARLITSDLAKDQRTKSTD